MYKPYKQIKLASILGILGNIFLMIIKGVIGFITNSNAMLADCFNSTSDVFSSILTYIGNKIASKPKDDDHNLGHGKAEYIYALLISIIMFLLGGKTLLNSLTSLIKGKTYNFSIWLIVVCLITIVVKLSLYFYTNHIAKKYHNFLLKANATDHRNDSIITTCNLISCLFSILNIYFIDCIVGILISLWIIITAFQIFKDSYNILMDKSIDDETKNKVLNIIKKYPEIKKINHFNSTPVGYRYQISFTIFVDGNLSTFESHAIADKLEDEIEENLKEIYLTVIHVNPL